MELFYDFNGFQLLFPALFWLFGRGLGCCFGDFCDFSYFFLLFSGFWAGFGVLFGEFLRFQLLFSCSFSAFWLDLGCCFADFSGFSYFFLIFSSFLESSPNLCVNSSSSYISPSMLPLSSGDLIEWSLVCHSTLSYQKFCDRHSNHYDHPEELHQSVE